MPRIARALACRLPGTTPCFSRADTSRARAPCCAGARPIRRASNHRVEAREEVLRNSARRAPRPRQGGCARHARGQDGDAAGLGGRRLAESLCDPARASSINGKGAGSGQGDRCGRSGCGQRPAGHAPRWFGAGGAGGTAGESSRRDRGAIGAPPPRGWTDVATKLRPTGAA